MTESKHTPGWDEMCRCKAEDVDAIMAACALLDSLIPPPGLERSGEMIEIAECKSGKWYWWNETLMLAQSSRYGLTAFVDLRSDGSMLMLLLNNNDKVELPSKDEEKAEASPSPKAPTQLVLELEAQLHTLEKRFNQHTRE